MRRKGIAVVAGCILIVFLVFFTLYQFNVIPHRRYTNRDFGIDPYVSSVDRDGDGIDDQTDILNNVKNYVAKNPKYKSKYYATGYPDDEYGVCTDVVAFGLKNAGYDLMKLVHEDIMNHKEDYSVETVDRNIDFRRVRNLKVYFENNHIALTTDLSDIEEWQGGDIVIFQGHIGVVSDVRNKKGIPFLIHHANPLQVHYEEDVLEQYEQEIVGHYRIS